MTYPARSRRSRRRSQRVKKKIVQRNPETERSLIAPGSGELIGRKNIFAALERITPEQEWFADLRNLNTRAAYRRDVIDFLSFFTITTTEQLREHTRRAHILAWRAHLESQYNAATIRRKLSAVRGFFEHLCDRDVVESNPVDGVRRPREHSNEGLTPAISSKQARDLLDAPALDTISGLRDRAILSVFLHEAQRISAVCGLNVRDYTERRGYKVLRMKTKGEKILFVEAHPETRERIEAYLQMSGHGIDPAAPLFLPTVNNATKDLAKHLSRKSVWHLVKRHARVVGITMEGFCPHSLRATAITQALEAGSELSRVQAWVGHVSPTTTKLYDKRHLKPEQSPTFNTNY